MWGVVLGMSELQPPAVSPTAYDRTHYREASGGSEAWSSSSGARYFEDAVAFARHTIEVHGVGEKAEVILVDARAIPVRDGQADLVTLLDVVEHLTPVELPGTLAEARRLLRPGGRLLVHTFPNRTIYEIVYKLQRALVPWRRRSWPRARKTYVRMARRRALACIGTGDMWAGAVGPED